MTGNVPIHPDDEARVAIEMTRQLEAMAADHGIRPPAGFADQVMAAVAGEPLPQPARAFKVALLGGRLRAAIASLGDAWRVVGGGSTPVFVRAQALALVLVLTIGSLALAGGATVGAIDLLSADQSTTPNQPTSGPTEPLASPMAEPSPSSTPDASPDASPEPSPTPEASETTQPTPIETPTDTQHPRNPTPRPTATDDHGGGSGGGGDGGGETPSPMPTESDDHGGLDG